MKGWEVEKEVGGRGGGNLWGRGQECLCNYDQHKVYSVVTNLPNVARVQEINWEENSNCFLYHPTFLHFHM